MSKKWIVPVLGLGVFIVAGLLWYVPEQAQSDARTVVPSEQDAASLDVIDESIDSGVESPFEVTDNVASTTAVERSTNADVSSVSNTDLSVQGNAANALPEQAVFIDVSQIGRSAIADDEFESLVARLQTDPDLLKQLIDEFRQENDPERRALLARLLGDTGGPDVLLTASELIYSGDADARKLGLDLLQKVQPGNAEARDIASGLLATAVEPDVLVDTLTTLARPGSVDDVSRDFLTEQVAILTDHEDASVRGVSLNILSRWSNDFRYTPVLVNGLQDQAPTVRESAAYALVGHEDQSQGVIDSLLAVAANTDERERTRRGSILALRGMPISDALRAQVDSLERELDKRPR